MFKAIKYAWIMQGLAGDRKMSTVGFEISTNYKGFSLGLFLNDRNYFLKIKKQKKNHGEDF